MKIGPRYRENKSGILFPESRCTTTTFTQL